MPSRVEEIVTEIIALASAKMPSVVFDRGRAALRNHQEIPRCIFMRTRDQPMDAERLRSGERTVETLLVTIEAHIVADGTTTDNAEQIQHLVIAAAHRVAVASFELGDSTWTEPDNSTLGELVITELRFRVPVIEYDDREITKTTPTTFTHATGQGVPGDNALECDEP